MAATTRHPAVAGTAAARSRLHPHRVAPTTAPTRTTTTAAVAPGANTSHERKYAYIGGYDLDKMADILTHHLPTALRVDRRWDSRSLPNLRTLMGLIEADPEITDMRWVAYMLATAYWETNHIEKIAIPRTNSHGVAVKDRLGNVISRNIKINVSLKPAPETGEGQSRRYARPVKVAQLPTGDIQITEYDGDQFTVGRDGTFAAKANLMNPRVRSDMGTAPTLAATRGYAGATGNEHTYYGRGYVQLTWWANYAKAGPLLGLPAAFFLLDPEQALEATYSYRLMSLCMRTGAGFANHMKFSMYFSGHDRHYLAARAMVNGSDCATEIANIACAFEDILWDSRKVTS